MSLSMIAVDSARYRGDDPFLLEDQPLTDAQAALQIFRSVELVGNITASVFDTKMFRLYELFSMNHGSEVKAPTITPVSVDYRDAKKQECRRNGLHVALGLPAK